MHKTPFMMTLRNGSFLPTVSSFSVQKPATTVRRPFEVNTRQGLRLKLVCASFQKVSRGLTIFIYYLANFRSLF